MTLLMIAAAWVIGTFVAVQYDLPMSALALFLLSACLFIVLLRAMKRQMLPGLLLIVMLMGVMRVVGLSNPTANVSLDAYHGQEVVRVVGTIASDPEPVDSATRFRLNVTSIELNGHSTPAKGTVLVKARETSKLAAQRDKPYFRYGDMLSLRGNLEVPPSFDDFDYAGYLARQGISTVMYYPSVGLMDEGKGSPFYQWLYSLRGRLATSLERSVSEPQASVTNALILGLRKSLPQNMVDDFNTTGTSHILAISGLNIAIFLGIVLALSQFLLGRRRQLYLLLPFLGVWFYALISGMSPSVVRAAIMASVYLLARLSGRQGSVLPSLGLAAAIMVGITPSVLWDVSFQLSFASVAGIAALAQPIKDWLQKLVRQPDEDGRLVSLLLDAVAITLAATVATYPLIAFYFHRASTVGAPATLLAVPALTPILVFGAVTAVVGLASPVLALPLGWFTWAFSAYLTEVVHLFSLIPGSSIEIGDVAPYLVWGYYMALLAAVASVHFRGRFSLRDESLAKFKRLLNEEGAPWPLVVAAIAVAALVWVAALTAPDAKLRVAFLDVGQGDSIFIATPAGQQVLIDGGPDPMGAVRELGQRMPFWDRSLDLLVLTHPHQDHANGLVEVLGRYEIGQVLERAQEYDSAAYAAWRKLVQEKGIPVLQAGEGQTIALRGGVNIQVLWPEEELLRKTSSDVNNGSVVLRLTYGSVSFLLTGDIQQEVESEMVARGTVLNSTVLKVAHQGSRTSSSQEFLDAVTPQSAVVLVSEDNLFGHPHQEVVDRLLRQVPQGQLFITRDNGDVQFTTDGSRLWVSTDR